MVAYLQRRHYRPMSRPMRSCHPRDLLEQVTALCRYRGIEPVITRELLDAACASYFVDEAVNDGGARAPSDGMMCEVSDSRADFLSRLLIGALFALMSANLLSDFLRTGRVTGLLLLASESLVVVFTIVRRPAQSVDRSLAAGSTTMLSLVGPELLRAGGGAEPGP